MKRGRRAPGLSATARASLPARFSTSLSGLLRGVAMTSRPCLIVQSYVSGSRAAIQSGGCGCCSGLGTDVARGNFQMVPSWA